MTFENDLRSLSIFIFAASVVYWVLILLFLLWLFRRISSLRERISALEAMSADDSSERL
ncbi:MAG: hypothetical protein N2V77_05080 [Canidatus Methanoxibalbensis ujae]|nr:hypothetical protein [Candidatus Methanoxibalbensis ujae]MCW7077919.1 hypothetical protein [Candidatus Methanoxibalbensis ujae]